MEHTTGSHENVVRTAPDRHAKRRQQDEAVLHAVRRGDPGAFERFVERFGQRIHSFGMRMCNQREDAEDVFQETLVTAYRKLSTLREAAALTTWLYRIVTNACWTSRRRSKFAPAHELSLEELLPGSEPLQDGPILPEEAGPVEEVYRRELSEKLDHAMRDLPPEYRVVWMMRDVEGLTTKETAEALQISIPNVKMRLHRARLALRKSLAHLRPSGDPV
jgi:RNA polymerase sigma-70 factor (ECF subfamily)